MMLFEIAGYQLIEKLSEHGTYRMYCGQRLQDGTAVLIKLLKPSNPAPKDLLPFLQEFEILWTLDLTGVVKVYALENDRQKWMIVAEDFGGRPLDQPGISGFMEPEEYLNLALQLADIVGELHARQVVHRNISPSNIFYNPSSRQAKLANFETASLVSREKAPLQNPYALAEFLAYVSPEMTGRMNRSVDYRTDYYSLGATLYEALTGSPPFDGKTPLELVHAHLATLPDPPSLRIEPWRASLPAFQILSAILLKLLAKNPEDRYQTASALRADLHHCLAVLQNPDKEGFESPTFIPGQADRRIDLYISQLVIGREPETQALQQAFLRTAGGPAELVLVSGEAGVGKTTLVNQLIRPVTERMGFFLYGKLDQDRPLAKYHALRQVLEEFCRLVLSEPAASLRDWRQRVQTSLEVNGQLLIDLCPQLERLIGPQPPVEPVDESFARARLHQVVIHFLQAVCQPEHPVVVFLDDLQWINPDGLLLWQSILSSPSIKNLLIVGAYRDNATEWVERIERLVEEARATQRGVTQIQLQNLEWSQIRRLVAAALASDQHDLSELTNLVYRRTEGNPFFSHEFLKKLYADKLLAFHSEDQTWHWDADRIEGYELASNVVELFIRKVEKLDPETQNVLQLSACIGRRFDTATLLALAGEEKASSLASSLWKAVAESLIQPLDDNYSLLAARTLKGRSVETEDILPSLVQLLEGQILLEFQHDRIQQAVLATLEEGQLKKYSLQIGRLLLEKAERAGEDAVRKVLFNIVDHLNTGSALIEDPAEAVKAAQLNLMASNQARALAAFETASSYLSAGLQLLPPGSWQHQYTLTLEIYTAAAEIALLNSDLARAEELALMGEEYARTPLEKARLIRIRMDTYMIQTQLDRVLELGFTTIQMLGFDLQAQELPGLLGEEFMGLPEMTDPHALAVSRLAGPLFSAAFLKHDSRFVELELFFINLFSRYGNPSTAGYIYIGYAMLMLRQFKQVEQACRLGTLALRLTEKGGPSRTLYAVRYLYYAVIHHWIGSAREGLERLHENIQPAFESGNIQFAIASQDMESQNSLFVGLPLEEVQSKQARALQQLKLLKQAGLTQRLRIWSQVVSKLIGEQLRPKEMTGDLFTDEEAQELIRAGQNQSFLFNLYCAEAFLSLVFREPQRASESSAAAHALKLSVGAHLSIAHHLFVYSLALLSAGPEADDLEARLEKVEENLRLMRLWASLVPENFLHQLELVEAERARCLGLDEQAAESYERAIHDAMKNGYIHEGALAAELAAEFYLARDDILVARDFLHTAYFSYLAWGATAKVDELVMRYPDWLPPGGDEATQISSASVAEVRPTEALDSSIDLTSILKASLELAYETNLRELLRKLMSILIQNAGAQNGSLVLWSEDRWVIEVQSSSGGPEPEFDFLSIPLEDQNTLAGGPRVPLSIINYVINSRVDLVLQDVSASQQFSQDAYIRNQRPKSILCAPLLNQGVLSGVIYLENNLVPGAMTSDRLKVVQLISGQAAVSIEKARLYEHLERLVAERTRELTEANTRLKDEIDERTQVEEALRLSENRYRTVVENTGTGIAVVDEDGYITFTNEEFRRLTGYSRYALRSHFNFMSVVAPEDAAGVSQLLLTRLENSSRSSNSFEFQLVDSSGVEKAVLSTTTLLPGFKVTILSLIDISARKSAEQALRESEERLSGMIGSAMDAIITIDQEQRIMLFNPAAEQMFHCSAAEVMGRTLDSLLPERVRSIHREHVRRFGETGMTRRAMGALEPLSGLRANGEEFPIEASISQLKYRGQRFYTVILRDITERKQAEEALHQSEQRLNRAQEIAHLGSWELDLLNNRLTWSEEVYRIFGLQPQEFGATYEAFLEAVHPEDRAAVDYAYSSSMREGRDSYEIEHRVVKRSSGEVRIVHEKCEHLRNQDGQIIRSIGMVHDITERKQIELLLQENEARLRLALDSAQLAPFDFNILTGEPVWDARTKSMWGVPVAESPGYAETLQRIHPEDRERAELAFARATDSAGTGELELELRVVSPDGSVHWLSAKGRVSFIGEGEQRQPARLLGILQNITERKHAEAKLEHAQKVIETERLRYRDLFDFAPDAYLVTSVEGKISEANDAAYILLGSKDPQLTGSLLISLVHPRDRSAFRARLNELAVLQQDFHVTGNYREWEVRLRQWRGSYFDASITVTTVPATRRETASLRWLVRDISARKKAQRALRESEERLRMALDSAQLAPFNLNLRTRMMIWDDRLEKLLGEIQAGETVSYAELLQSVHPDDQQLVEQIIDRASNPGELDDFEQEFRILWPNGEMRWLSAKGKVSLSGEDGRRRDPRLVGILRDITARKEIEEAHRYNEALLQHVLENLPVGVWILDKTGRIVSGNPEGLKIWSGAKYLGLGDYGEYKAWRLDTGEPISPHEWAGGLAITQGKTTLNEELEIQAFDGAHRVILNSAIPLVTQQDGLVGAIVVNQDITRRKQEEEEVQRVSEQLSTLLQISQATSSTLDLDGLLKLTIEQLEKLLPYDVAALLLLEQNFLEFRVIRGPSIFDSLSHHKIPLNEFTMIDQLIEAREEIYFPDLKAHEHLFQQIEEISKIPYSQFAPIRSILCVPLIARNDLIGVLILGHFQTDQYPLQSQILARLFANEVSIAIQNAQLYKRAQHMAALEERNRLARELHDSVAQALYSISLFTDATLMALKTDKPEVVKNNLVELVDLSRQAMADMRLLIFELRPPALEEIGLMAALQSRLNAVESRTGMQAVLHSTGELSFSAEEENELYRITQEALNNVIKHADASRVWVRVSGEPGRIWLVIEDDGVGFDPDSARETGGDGLRNIHERAEKIGARCWIESAPDQGTKVTVEVKK